MQLIPTGVPEKQPAPILPRVLRLFAPYRRRVVLWLSVILVSSVIGIVAPLLTKFVFDRALFPKHGHQHLGLLAVLVGLMLASVALGGLLAIVQTYLSNAVGQQVMHDLRDQLYTHLRQMSLAFFTTTRTGEIQSRIANDVGGIGGVVTTSASILLSSGLFMIASLVAMVILSWQLTLLALVVVPGFVFVARRVGRVRKELSLSTQETLAQMSVITQETLSISGVLLTKMFDGRGEAANRYRAESQRLASLRVRQEMAGRTLIGLSQGFVLASPAILYFVAGFWSLGLSAGSIVAFTVLQARLFSPALDVLNLSLSLYTSAPLFNRVFEYLDLPHDVADSADSRVLEKRTARGAVALRDVRFRYAEANGPSPAREWTLDGVSLSIEPGQLAAIVGPSGAGKTTISYLVPRLYDVVHGSVEIDGLDVRTIKLASLSEIVGMVTQETYLLHASVRENLRFADPDASDEEMERATRAAFIHERVLEFPEGYDTVIGERGYRLSGGEKQRLAIARAILRDPRILILDEATSALDTVSERLVQTALQSLVTGRTTIAIAHRLSTVLAADVIFVLDYGRVIEQGTHDELVASGGLYAQLYEQQFQSGLVEARCEDGVVLATGEVVSLVEPEVTRA